MRDAMNRLASSLSSFIAIALFLATVAVWAQILGKVTQ